MNYNSFKKWLEALDNAWTNRDPKAAANLCCEDVLYYETPFGPPLKSRKEVERIWEDVPRSQKDIHFSSDIISVNNDVGIAHWQVSFIKLPSNKKVILDGVFVVKLDKADLCKEFHQWWVPNSR